MTAEPLFLPGLMCEGQFIEDECRAEKGALTPHYRCVALPDGLQGEERCRSLGARL